MVQITERRYKQLVEDSNKLAALEAGGVDNWEGYSSCFEDEEDEDDDDE